MKPAAVPLLALRVVANMFAHDEGTILIILVISDVLKIYPFLFYISEELKLSKSLNLFLINLRPRN